MNLKLAIKQVGGVTAFARALSVSPQVVANWCSRKKVPADHCPTIERLTDGACQVDALRPDITWARIPDPSWPHPAGRPCVDLVAVKETSHA